MSVVRERIVTPDEIMTMGPDRQFVIAAPRDMPRDALALYHARYWERRDCRGLADPNPFVVRKQGAAVEGGEAMRGRRRPRRERDGRTGCGGRRKWGVPPAEGSAAESAGRHVECPHPGNRR